MSFTFEKDAQQVYRCDDCGWIQTKTHFRAGPNCTMCNSPASKVRETESSTGMSDFKYRELLTSVEDDADGVGSATVENIEQHFSDGDDFLDAANEAYNKLKTDALQSVHGVGHTSARQIALVVADVQGWSDGAIFEYGE